MPRSRMRRKHQSLLRVMRPRAGLDIVAADTRSRTTRLWIARWHRGSRPGQTEVAQRQRFSATTVFRSVPIPLISTSKVSPGFIAWVVPGVPVKMTSPGSSVT